MWHKQVKFTNVRHKERTETRDVVNTFLSFQFNADVTLVGNKFFI